MPRDWKCRVRSSVLHILALGHRTRGRWSFREGQLLSQMRHERRSGDSTDSMV